MEYRKIGKWGIKVSEIGLGSWLTYGQSVSEAESLKQIDYAFNNGINFFDTANVYGLGSAEQTVGKALHNLRRDSYVLATKVFFPMGDGPNDHGLSRKHIFEQCHASLQRLQTDYIDLYQCHRYDASVSLYEIVRSMDDLARQGKILYWGVSEWSAENIQNAFKLAQEINALPPISNQPRYNMLSREIEHRVLPTCHQLGIGQLVFSPLAQGVLTSKYKLGQAPPEHSRAADGSTSGFIHDKLTEENLLMVEELKALANELHLSVPQLALAWCLRLPEITSTIIGATSIAHIEDNRKASGVKIPDEILTKIDQLLKGKVASHG